MGLLGVDAGAVVDRRSGRGVKGGGGGGVFLFVLVQGQRPLGENI